MAEQTSNHISAGTDLMGQTLWFKTKWGKRFERSTNESSTMSVWIHLQLQTQQECTCINSDVFTMLWADFIAESVWNVALIKKSFWCNVGWSRLQLRTGNIFRISERIWLKQRLTLTPAFYAVGVSLAVTNSILLVWVFSVAWNCQHKAVYCFAAQITFLLSTFLSLCTILHPSKLIWCS